MSHSAAAASTTASTASTDSVSATGAARAVPDERPPRPPRPSVRSVVTISLSALVGLLVLVAIGELSGQILLIPAMAGTMALVAAAPTFALAQPRNVILGQTLSAVVGLAVGLVSHSMWAAAVGASLSIAVMLVARCAHAPAAATAVIAVLTTQGHGTFLVCVVAAAALITGSAVASARFTKSGYPARWW